MRLDVGCGFRPTTTRTLQLDIHCRSGKYDIIADILKVCKTPKSATLIYRETSKVHLPYPRIQQFCQYLVVKHLLMVSEIPKERPMVRSTCYVITERGRYFLHLYNELEKILGEDLY